jgi:hypothetical protein
MRCSVCGGYGWLSLMSNELLETYTAPCNACGGYGIIHCCEGLQEQPERVTEQELGTDSNPVGR